MSKPTSIILLCEDNLTSTLLRSYLRHCGIDRGIRVNTSPVGKGAAENWVIRHYPEQVNAYRQQKAKTDTWLIVVLDADTGTVVEHIEQLNSSLRNCGNQRLREIEIENEKIARLIPRRNVETWIVVLSGTVANEEEDYSNRTHRDDWYELIHPASRELYALTRLNARIPARCIDSLHRAIRELTHLSQIPR